MVVVISPNRTIDVFVSAAKWPKLMAILLIFNRINFILIVIAAWLIIYMYSKLKLTTQSYNKRVTMCVSCIRGIAYEPAKLSCLLRPGFEEVFSKYMASKNRLNVKIMKGGE